MFCHHTVSAQSTSGLTTVCSNREARSARLEGTPAIWVTCAYFLFFVLDPHSQCAKYSRRRCSNKVAWKRLARRHSRSGPWTHECCFEVDVFLCWEWIKELRNWNGYYYHEKLRSSVTPPNLMVRKLKKFYSWDQLELSTPPPRGEFLEWIPNQVLGGRGPEEPPPNLIWGSWGSLFWNHPTNPHVLGIPTISILGGGFLTNNLSKKRKT